MARGAYALRERARLDRLGAAVLSELRKVLPKGVHVRTVELGWVASLTIGFRPHSPLLGQGTYFAVPLLPPLSEWDHVLRVWNGYCSRTMRPNRAYFGKRAYRFIEAARNAMAIYDRIASESNLSPVPVPGRIVWPLTLLGSLQEGEEFQRIPAIVNPATKQFLVKHLGISSDTERLHLVLTAISMLNRLRRERYFLSQL